MSASVPESPSGFRKAEPAVGDTEHSYSCGNKHIPSLHCHEGLQGGRHSAAHPVPPHQWSPRALLLMRLRWLLEVWDSRVACWWLESTGLVAMMLSLYLFIRDSFALSLPGREELKATSFREKDQKEEKQKGGEKKISLDRSPASIQSDWGW